MGAGARVVVVNQKLTAIVQGHRVRSGIGIRQTGQGHHIPIFPLIVGNNLEKFVVMRTANGLERAVVQKQNAWLDGADGFSVVDGWRGCPGVSKIRRAFEMDFPAVAFGTAAVLQSWSCTGEMVGHDDDFNR